jgi:hypothetical protein
MFHISYVQANLSRNPHDHRLNPGGRLSTISWTSNDLTKQHYFDRSPCEYQLAPERVYRSNVSSDQQAFWCMVFLTKNYSHK